MSHGASGNTTTKRGPSPTPGAVPHADKRWAQAVAAPVSHAGGNKQRVACPPVAAAGAARASARANARASARASSWRSGVVCPGHGSRAESGETDAEVTGGDEAGGVSQRTPNLQLRNGQLAAVVVCAPACRQASTKVIRAATGFIGAHGDGGRQFGQIRAGFGEGLI